MLTRRVVAVLVAVGSVALLWVPYFRWWSTEELDVVDWHVSFPALWLARIGIVLTILGAVAVFTGVRWATASAAAAVIVTLAAGVVPAWRTTHSAACAGWVFYGSAPGQCTSLTMPHPPVWGWGLALLLAVVLATLPTWRSHRITSGRGAASVAAALAVAALASATFGPLFHPLYGSPRKYVDYLPAHSMSASGWHGWFAPIGLVLLVLAAALGIMQQRGTVAIAALAVAAIVVAGADRPGYPQPTTLGWAYWVVLGCAVAALAVLTFPRPRRQWSVSPTVVSYN